jgi:hypothetical protein
MAIPVMTEFGKTMKSLYGWILPEAFNVTEARLVYPIPQHEYDFNKLLTDE